MANGETKGLSRDDLLLFMEWYKTTAATNTTLLEQQKVVLEKQSELLSKVVIVSTSLDKISESIAKNSKAITNFQNECGQNYIQGKSQSSIEHGKITNKIYITYGVLGGICLSLIGLFIHLNDKLDLIEEIAKVVLT